MKITLRKSNALQTAIQDAVKTIEIKTSVSVNEFQDPASELDKATQRLLDNERRRSELTFALYVIREQVAEANAASGINSRLTRAAHIDKRLGQLQGLIGAEVRTDQSVLNGKLDKIRNRKEESRASFYGNADEVATGVLTLEHVETFKAEQRNLRKDKQKLNDEILELNVRTEIELNDNVVKILTTEHLL